MTAEELYNLGYALMVRGHLDEAIAQFQASLSLDADDPDTHNDLGVAYKRQGRLDDARKEWEIALRLSPGHANAKNNLSLLQVYKKALQGLDLVAGRPALTQIMAGKGTTMSVEELRKQAELASRRGDFDEARAHLQAALIANPKDPDIHADLSKTYRREGRLKEARRELQRALRLSARPKRCPDLESLSSIEKALKGWSAERARQALEEIVGRRVVFWTAIREPHETIPRLVFEDAEGPRGFMSTQLGPMEWADVQGIKLVWPCYTGLTDPFPFKYEAIWFPQGCIITISLGLGPVSYGELGHISTIPNEQRESGKQLIRALLNDPTLDMDFKLSLFQGGSETNLYESASGILELNTKEDGDVVRGYLLVRDSGKRVGFVQESVSGRVLSPSGEVLYDGAPKRQAREHRLWPWKR